MSRGVFFDLYGTLLIYGDMKKAWADWLFYFHQSLTECGLSMSLGEFSTECDQFFSLPEPSIVDATMTVFEKRIKRLTTWLNVNICKDDISFVANLIIEKWHQQISLDSDAIPTIQALKKQLKVGLVSNFDHPSYLRRYLAENKMQALFDTIVISGEVGVKKPNPDIFKSALLQTALDPHSVFYIGDTADDVTAAKSAGMTPIFIQRQEAATDRVALDFEVDYESEVETIQMNAKTINRLTELTGLLDG